MRIIPKIDRGIPIPPPNPSKSRDYKWPWLKLDVGDSFLAPLDGADEMVVRHRMRAQCVNTGKKLSKTFRAERDKRGVRVWRTA